MRYLAVLSMLFLAACASPTPLDVQVSCPPLKIWSAADQTALASALSPIPQSSPVWTMAADWEQMRSELKACQPTPKP